MRSRFTSTFYSDTSDTARGFRAELYEVAADRRMKNILKDLCFADCDGVGEGKFLKHPGCLADCFPADHCLTSLVRDFTGVCPGSYPSKYYPQLWFTSDTSCSFLEEGDLHFSASDPYQIKRGLCSAETEALLLDQENCVQHLLSQRDDILTPSSGQHLPARLGRPGP